MNAAIKKMFAVILDFILIFLCLVIVSFFIAWIIRLFFDDTYKASMVLRAIGSWGTFAPWSVMALVALYFGWFESSFWQASLGKKIMGLKVVDDSESRIFFWRSLGRFVLYMTVFPVSWIFILVTKNHEGLHDWMSGTKVIEA